MICSKCVMDDTVSDIVFDDKGICNYCYEAGEELELIKLTNAQSDQILLSISQRIKDQGKNR